MSWDSQLGIFAFPSDAALALQRLASDAASVNTSVAACTTLDAPTKTEWASFYTYVQTLTAENPVWFFPTGPHDVLTTGYLSETIIQAQRTLLAWQQRISGKCTSPPVLDPNSGDIAHQLGGALAGSSSTIQWVAAAVAVVGAAYLGGQVVTLIPSAKLRARTARERERTTRVALKRS